jgi:hypothetical protein
MLRESAVAVDRELKPGPSKHETDTQMLCSRRLISRAVVSFSCCDARSRPKPVSYSIHSGQEGHTGQTTTFF